MPEFNTILSATYLSQNLIFILQENIWNGLFITNFIVPAVIFILQICPMKDNKP
jgi:hypothetical protein